MVIYPSDQALRRARRRWRERRRAEGLSWTCVVSNHVLCTGWVGRLRPPEEVRPLCQCKCHREWTEEDMPWSE